MECWEVREYLDSLLDNEINPVTRIWIEKHLAKCKQCSRIFVFQRQIKQLLKDHVKRIQAPAVLKERILWQIEEIDRIPSFRSGQAVDNFV